MSVLYQPFEIFRRLSHRRWVWLGAPLFLYLWSVTGPFLLDDLYLLNETERYIRGERNRLALFEFAPTDNALREMIDRGSFPWWIPSGLRIAFFRPLAEWSFYADVRIFDRWVVGHRLVSLAWFALALVIVHRLYRAVGGDPTRAGAATFLFGISLPMSAPVAFICNRSDLFVVAGTALAAWAYWTAAERPAWRTLLISAIGFAFALLSKEMALPLVAVIVAYDLLSRRRGWRAEGGRARGSVAVLLVIMTVIYLTYYLTTKPAGSELAKNWFTLALLALTFPKAVGLFLAVWTMGFPISLLSGAGTLWMTALTVLTILLGMGLGALTIRYFLKRLGEDSGVLFFLIWAGMFLGMALLAAGEPRALSVATVGWSYLVAGLLLPRADGTGWAPLWLRHWLFTANGLVAVVITTGSLIVSSIMERQAQDLLREYLKKAQPSPVRDGDTLIIKEAKADLEMFVAGDRLAYLTGFRHACIAYLTVAGTGATIRRLDDHTLSLTSDSPRLFGSPMHKMAFGMVPRYKVGMTFSTKDFTVEIAAVKDNIVRELRVRFNEPLTSPRLHFYPAGLAAIARGEPASRPTSRRVN